MRRLLLVLMLLSQAAVAEPARGWIYYDEPKPVHFVIRDQESFMKFRAKLPEEAPSKKRPAPKNSDPFLRQAPDFSKEMLVVVACGETISSHPRLLKKKSSGTGVTLVVEIPEPPPEARPYGWGVYLGITLPASTGKVQVEYR